MNWIIEKIKWATNKALGVDLNLKQSFILLGKYLGLWIFCLLTYVLFAYATKIGNDEAATITLAISFDLLALWFTWLVWVAIYRKVNYWFDLLRAKFTVWYLTKDDRKEVQ